MVIFRLVYNFIFFFLTTGILFSPHFVNSQNVEWGKSIGGIDEEIITSFVIDVEENLYSTGNFKGTVDFDAGIDTFNLTCIGYRNGFITKFDSLGNFVWAKRIERSGETINIDLDHNIYVSGSFIGTVDFDPGPGVFTMTAISGADCYIIKLDSAGNFIWAKGLIGQGGISSSTLTIDINANLFLAGNFGLNEIDFDPGPGTFNLLPNGSYTGFVVNLDSAGNFIMAKSYGGQSYTTVTSLSVDIFGNIYITGFFEDSTDFDPSSNIFMLNSSGGNDIFILKLNQFGNLLWAHSLGEIENDIPWDIIVDSNANVYLTGGFYNTVDFDPGVGIYNLVSIGHKDIFILKLNTNSDFLWAKSIGNSYYDTGESISIDENANIYISGTYQGNADFDPNSGIFNLDCSLDATYDPFILKLDSAGDFQSAKCIGGSSWTGYMEIQTSIKNNIFVSGSFNPDSSSIDFMNGTVLLCNGLTDIFYAKYNQCEITLSNQIISSCNSYTSPSGNYVWYSSGIYNDTILNLTGCDSIVTINLTITTVDTSVSHNGITLTANTNGAIQWVDCDDNFNFIIGETGQDFTPSINGNYAVIINENGCIDTSACYNVTGVGISENYSKNNIWVFPNPAKNILHIKSSNKIHNAEFLLFDVLGNIIIRQKIHDTPIIDISKISPALYFYELRDSFGLKSAGKIIKN